MFGDNMRHLIAYDTTTGQLLDAMSKDVDPQDILSGTGDVAEHLLVGSGFSASVRAEDRCRVTLPDGRTINSSVVEVVDDDTLRLSFSFPDCGDVPFVIVRAVPASQYTDAERDAFLARVKAEVDHDNVGIARLLADIIPSGQYRIDLNDGDKIKKKEDQIVYE